MVKIGKKNFLFGRSSAGVTLIEVMMALAIMAVAVFPILGAFTKFYGVSTKQLDQEIALKVGEATMNKLLEHKFSQLAKSQSFTINDLNFKTPNGNLTGVLNFDGKIGKSSKLKLGKSVYEIEFIVTKLFKADDPAAAIKFVYPYLLSNSVDEDTYSCRDDFLALKVIVRYSQPVKEIELIAFRADMTK
jgi:prepilin-type N-terminal cleavage/methylation domain-containing protein